MEKKVIKFRPKVISEEKLFIDTPFIKLDSAMKLAGVVGTGGEAKMLIEDSLVKVNGEICVQRGKKLYSGDTFFYKNSLYTVTANEDK